MVLFPKTNSTAQLNTVSTYAEIDQQGIYWLDTVDGINEIGLYVRAEDGTITYYNKKQVYTNYFLIGQIATSNNINWHSSPINYGFNSYNNRADWGNANISPQKDMPTFFIAPFKMKISKVVLSGLGYTPALYNFIFLKYKRENMSNIGTVGKASINFISGDFSVKEITVLDSLNDIIIEEGESLSFIWQCENGANKYVFDLKLQISYEKIS